MSRRRAKTLRGDAEPGPDGGDAPAEHAGFLERIRRHGPIKGAGARTCSAGLAAAERPWRGAARGRTRAGESIEPTWMGSCISLARDDPDDPAWGPVREALAAGHGAHVEVHAEALEGRYATCSLKVSSQIQALTRFGGGCEVVALVDADADVPPDWLRRLVAPFADPRVGAQAHRPEHDDRNWPVMQVPSNWYLQGLDRSGSVWFLE